MSVTVRDIAKRCHVSPGTVSRVLNNRDNVKEETRLKVQEVLREMQYDPMETAPPAQKISVTTYGLVLPVAELGNRSDYYNRAVGAFSDSMEKNEIRCVLLNERRLVKILLEEKRNPRTVLGVDKVILMGINQPVCDRLLERLHAWGIPAALIRRKTGKTGVPMISDDDAKAVRTALNHMCGYGHRTLAFVNERSSYLETRAEAFKEYVCDKNLNEFDGQVFVCLDGNKEIEAWAEKCHDTEGVTAFLCTSDEFAIRIIKHFNRMGVPVPGDVSVMSIDGGYLTGMYSPGITTVRVPVEKMVELGVMLLNGSDGWNADEPYVMEVPNELIVRESTATVKK